MRVGKEVRGKRSEVREEEDGKEGIREVIRKGERNGRVGKR